MSITAAIRRRKGIASGDDERRTLLWAGLITATTAVLGRAIALILAACTHQGCPVASTGPGFRCPCHGVHLRR
ncbi:Rieske 2Fe-2S domain-containing protein [Actinoplanes sp. NPDC089786]|uniref:Rieske 2Fe-2S domain-containing protein n=1 Tax=Actinoplanes sp. NPDC089786 TaxID=3155185 RepID=UPI0034122DC1